ncbi:hypothetical protein J31TS4_08920 [Paenibacillus sp. J31TS4]|uniref:stage III sporulation protein AF n=1 Tax=Paenibacillus sp. J31TS4 TaxID=2807195 RepID=UPI001B28C9A5|nr:stage III sporulation protein AF [Paenibacillus sp. J31TS4]GIP37612.1 hypothetical protein J31TS4_08920 [Paenibacillus sp. J31TS4]
MMQWIASWLKELIVLLLLASFVDLLLPNQSLQRYVKTVISLFLLVVLLTPVFRLVGSKWDAERLTRAALENDAGRGSASGSPAQEARAIPALETIVREAEQRSASVRKQAAELAERQLAERIAEQLRAEGEAARDVTVALRFDDRQRAEVASVAVRLPASPASGAAGGTVGTPAPSGVPPGRRTVEPVAPVNVTLGGGATGSMGATGTVASSASATPGAADREEQAQRRERIRGLLQREWAVPADRVAVIFEAG